MLSWRKIRKTLSEQVKWEPREELQSRGLQLSSGAEPEPPPSAHTGQGLGEKAQGPAHSGESRVWLSKSISQYSDTAWVSCNSVHLWHKLHWVPWDCLHLPPTDGVPKLSKLLPGWLKIPGFLEPPTSGLIISWGSSETRNSHSGLLERSFAGPLLPSCWAAQFLTGHGPVYHREHKWTSRRRSPSGRLRRVLSAGGSAQWGQCGHPLHTDVFTNPAVPLSPYFGVFI